MDQWIKEFPGAITVCDEHGIILDMNDKACDDSPEFPAGPTSHPAAREHEEDLRGIVPTLQRGNAAPDAPASPSATNHQPPHPPHHRGHGPLQPPTTVLIDRNLPCPRNNPLPKKQGRQSNTPAPLQPKPLQPKPLQPHSPQQLNSSQTPARRRSAGPAGYPPAPGTGSRSAPLRYCVRHQSGQRAYPP